MKTLVIILFALVAATGSGFAQNLIAVQNGGEPKFYSKLDSAIVFAVDSDTLYLPGGNFALNTDIGKRLHIIGVGHHPDSTLVTNPTIININSSLNLITGATGGSLMGIKLNGNLQFGTSSTDGNVCNYKVARCYVGSIISNSNASTNNLFYENIITNGGGFYFSISMNNAESNYFYNNIITGGFGGYSQFTVNGIGAGSIFKNNIFINNDYDYLNGVVYSVFENNIFAASSLFNPSYGIFNNIFNNNLFVTPSSYIFWTNWNNTGINNIFEQAQTSIWINQNGDSFSYSQDYHLQTTSPGKNAGRDGTDIGIYGGMFPWKEGSIPFNPHFQQVQISPKTDANGNLNVNIKVAAQER
jgi:hypothetical protein